MPAAPAKKTKKPTPAPAPVTPSTTPAPAMQKPAETTEQAATSTIAQREIIYPNVTAEICQGDNAITVDTMKMLLGWQTEKEWAKQLVDANPGIGDDEVVDINGVPMLMKDAKFFDKTGGYMLTDEHGDKIRCWQNLDNREFAPEWSKSLAQTIANFQWAGEITIPGVVTGIHNGKEIELPAGTVNGSTMVLSRTGRMESGQHSGVGLILAWQMWWKNRKAYPQWEDRLNDKGEQTGPVLETIVITGISEDPKVTMTVDNCKPRSATDVLYTSALFRDLPIAQRAEYSRMTAAAIAFLWKRTGTKGYMTNTEVMGFLDRHKRLLKCVEHLFQENQTKRVNGKVVSSRAISALKISAGQAAALCYLMGASATDGDIYRNGFPPSEKDVDWTNWDKAKKFWASIGRFEEFKPVREALAKLKDSTGDDEQNQGQGGRAEEKHTVICKAWDEFLANQPIFGEALTLNYTRYRYDPKLKASVEIPDGGVDLLDRWDLKGIDQPDAPKQAGTDGSADGEDPADIDQAAEKERMARENAQRQQDIIKNMRLGVGGKPVVAKPTAGPTTASAK